LVEELLSVGLREAIWAELPLAIDVVECRGVPLADVLSAAAVAMASAAAAKDGQSFCLGA
jgi:hypothetical protein